MVEDFISRGVDGIVLAPLDDRALVRPVADAVREGIPVVVIDSGLQGSDYASYVATDNYKGGVLAARRLGESPRRQGPDLPHPLSGRLGQHRCSARPASSTP